MIGFWSDERDAILTALWGHHSSYYIGVALKTSRNACIGRAHRIGLPGLLARRDPSQPMKPKIHREKRVALKKLQSKRDPLLTIPQAPKSNPIPFIDRAMGHQCAFSTSGEGYSMMVCGSNTIDGETYCQFHCSIVYTTPGQLSKPYYFDNTKRRAA